LASRHQQSGLCSLTPFAGVQGGRQLDEMKNINTSLTAFGKVRRSCSRLLARPRTNQLLAGHFGIDQSWQ